MDTKKLLDKKTKNIFSQLTDNIKNNVIFTSTIFSIHCNDFRFIDYVDSSFFMFVFYHFVVFTLYFIFWLYIHFTNVSTLIIIIIHFVHDLNMEHETPVNICRSPKVSAFVTCTLPNYLTYNIFAKSTSTDISTKRRLHSKAEDTVALYYYFVFCSCSTNWIFRSNNVHLDNRFFLPCSVHFEIVLRMVIASLSMNIN